MLNKRQIGFNKNQIAIYINILTFHNIILLKIKIVNAFLKGLLTMKAQNLFKKFIIIAFFPLNISIVFFSFTHPKLVEAYYTSCFNKLLREAFGSISNLFYFSLAEVFIVLFIILFLVMLIKFTINIKKHIHNKRNFLKWIIKIFCFINILYFIFLCCFGLNYYRHPISALLNLNVHASSSAELLKLCQNLISTTNNLSKQMKRNKIGDMILDDQAAILPLVPSVYQRVSYKYPFLSGSYSKPKPVILSKLMSYTGITGFYFPFTAEPNVNIDMPYTALPFTACHECAHERGFAREDEANFISYIVCNNSGNSVFMYSGNFNALIYSMNALYMYNQLEYYKLTKEYTNNLKHDLEAYNNYWQKFEGPIEQFSEKVNNAYLKANQQKNGIHSYGQMVDLLLAYYRKTSYLK